MSVAQQLPQPSDSGVSMAFLQSHVYLPTFLDKLAEYGHHPQTPAEVERYVTCANTLRSLNTKVASHQARRTVSLVEEANEELARLVGNPSPTSTSQAMAVKQAAARLAANPDVAHAVVSLRIRQAAERQ